MFVRISGERFRVLRQDAGRARGSSPMTSTRCPSMSTGASWSVRSGLPRRRSMSATGSVPCPRPSGSGMICSGQPWRMTAVSQTKPTAQRPLPPSPGSTTPRPDGCAACIMPTSARGSLTRSKPRESVRRPDYEAGYPQVLFQRQAQQSPHSLRVIYSRKLHQQGRPGGRDTILEQLPTILF